MACQLTLHPPLLPALPRQVDCVTSRAGYTSYGCNGGNSLDVMRYVKAFRATTEADYAYTAMRGTTCLEPNTSAVAPGSMSVAGYKVVTRSRAGIQAAVASGGPVMVYFSVQPSFLSYSGGVYPASSCNGTAVNHAMVGAGRGTEWERGGPAARPPGFVGAGPVSVCDVPACFFGGRLCYYTQHHTHWPEVESPSSPPSLLRSSLWATISAHPSPTGLCATAGAANGALRAGERKAVCMPHGQPQRSTVCVPWTTVCPALQACPAAAALLSSPSRRDACICRSPKPHCCTTPPHSAPQVHVCGGHRHLGWHVRHSFRPHPGQQGAGDAAGCVAGDVHRLSPPAMRLTSLGHFNAAASHDMTGSFQCGLHPMLDGHFSPSHCCRQPPPGPCNMGIHVGSCPLTTTPSAIRW